MLEIFTLGTSRARWQGQSLLPFRTQKAKALFFFLIVEWTYYNKSDHRREFLADLLWPDLDKKAALENLRQTLYIIRNKFKSITNQDLFKSNRITINKNEAIQINIDLWLLKGLEVFDLIQLPSIEHVPLSDLILYDCEPYYEWLMNFQAEIQQMSIDILSKNIEYQKALGNWFAVESLTVILEAQNVPIDADLYHLLAEACLNQGKNLEAVNWLKRAGLNQLQARQWIKVKQSEISSTRDKVAPRVAILPFKELQEDVSGISLGLVEDISSQLSQYKELEIVPTFSVLQFQNSEKITQKIAYELRVEYLISGTIRFINRSFKINLHLIDCSKDCIVWSTNLTKLSEDLFSIQQEVTSQLIDAFVNMKAIQRTEVYDTYVPKPEAYDWYLQAWSIYYKGTPKTTLKAKEYFKKAIECDPNYRRACLGILFTIGSSASWWGDCKMKDVYSEYLQTQKEAAKDPSLHPDLHAVNGWASMWNWDLEGAEKCFKKSISMNANIAFCWGGYAHALNMMGRHQEALQTAQQGVFNEPGYIQGFFILAECNLLLGNLDAAEKICKAALKQHPDLHSGITVLIWVLILQGKYREAIKIGEQTLRKTGRRTYFVIGRLALAYLANKEEQKASVILNEMLDRSVQGEKGFPYFIALYYQTIGKSQEALDILEKHIEDYLTDYLWLKVQPEFKSLHHLPRFQKIMDRVFRPALSSSLIIN